MQLRMEQANSLSLADMGTLIRCTETVQFEAQNRGERYAWVQSVLVDQEYHALGKKEKGVVRAYVSKMTGLSMPQVTRLIRQHRKEGRVEHSRKPRRKFAARFTIGDIVLLAEVDEAHERLSGPATKKILEREYWRFD